MPSPPNARAEALRRFDEVFKEATASEPHEITEAFRLRYQVYCLERGFEEAEAFAGGMERDQYDDDAFHTLLTDRKSGHALGTVRLIKPEAASDWLSELPLAAYAPPESVEELLRLPAGATAEVSRFAIARSARKLLRLVPRQDGTELEEQPRLRERLLPYMSLGLIRGLVRLSIEQGITHWCLAAEPSLLRRLRGFGLHFKDAGPLVDHRGLRQVCYAELKSLLERAEKERPEFWSVITQGGFLTPANRVMKAA
ncbi:PEP-CTERM/exosortase system-associated acyltransferase [Pelagibius sp.]|uniref:PEP-CTERM/exosortase system-associated acyltransferase n=1 Tax=Pelagibius sp. TaxID=1931238 RepID=UPI002637E9B5|nr:PEP-CTERM/exosortase system-associated acyltransferase [Pelagibius sp.]